MYKKCKYKRLVKISSTMVDSFLNFLAFSENSYFIFNVLNDDNVYIFLLSDTKWISWNEKNINFLPSCYYFVI